MTGHFSYRTGGHRPACNEQPPVPAGGGPYPPQAPAWLLVPDVQRPPQESTEMPGRKGSSPQLRTTVLPLTCLLLQGPSTLRS